MPSKLVVTLVILVLSEAAGIGLGEWFFHLFLKAVPPVALSEFNSQSARIAHWLYGAVVGVALFVWALLGMATNRMFQLMSKAKASP